MINWQYFPKSNQIPEHLQTCTEIFNKYHEKFDSSTYTYNSDEVLKFLSIDFLKEGYRVEVSKKKVDKINVPVLFGLNGKLEKSFAADAYNPELKTVLEVEAGRGVANYQFLKDLFQACLMHNVDYLVIAVRKVYTTVSSTSKDFEKVLNFFNALYASGRLTLPLKGILIIGY
ncbi:hypothetical protein [Mesobacillus jeotgali]|uniref:Uncharacterized protein n=1 Tax=Mesobacillus jeotgali TaxID=129985 RepID=A0ABY9VDM9_9BACI|nr:hypothetical protein [Mesobacillus jeotgali]WNF21314.1 hypothetical protein RH061_14030 [Mesobacillus jeotgali]